MSSQSTVFVIDVGNSNLHHGLIKNEHMVQHKITKHSELSSVPWDEIKNNNYPVVIAGALHHINSLIETIQTTYKLNFIRLETKNQNTIKNTYEKLGIDRVCNLIAALKLFDSSIIVCDFGTATTISTCNKEGVFLGGVLRAGIETELNAISTHPLSLPKVEIQETEKVTNLDYLAKSPEEAISQGVVLGQIAFIEHFVNLFKQKTDPKPKIVLTGGNALVITKLYKGFDLYDPHLTLKGMYYCYQSTLTYTN